MLHEQYTGYRHIDLLLIKYVLGSLREPRPTREHSGQLWPRAPPVPSAQGPGLEHADHWS